MYFYHPNGDVSSITRNKSSQHNKNNIMKKKSKIPILCSRLINNNINEHFSDNDQNVFNVNGNIGLSGRIEANEFCFKDNGQIYCLNKEFLKQNSNNYQPGNTNNMKTNNFQPGNTNNMKTNGEIKEFPLLNSNNFQPGNTNNMKTNGEIEYVNNSQLANTDNVKNNDYNSDNYRQIMNMTLSKFTNGNNTTNNLKDCETLCDNADDCYGYIYGSTNDNHKICYQIVPEDMMNFDKKLLKKEGYNTYVLNDENLKWRYGCDIYLCISQTSNIIHRNLLVGYHFNLSSVKSEKNIATKLTNIKELMKNDYNLNEILPLNPYQFVTGYIEVSQGGKYSFSFMTYKNVCLYFNDVPLVRYWNDQNPKGIETFKNVITPELKLEPNVKYRYQYIVEYNQKLSTVNHPEGFPGLNYRKITEGNGNTDPVKLEYFTKKSKIDEIHILYPIDNSKSFYEYTINTKMYPSLKLIDFNSFSFVLQITINNPTTNIVNLVHWDNGSNYGLSLSLKNEEISIKVNNLDKKFIRNSDQEIIVDVANKKSELTILISINDSDVYVYLNGTSINKIERYQNSNRNITSANPIIFCKNAIEKTDMGKFQINQCFIIPSVIVSENAAKSLNNSNIRKREIIGL